MPLEWNSQTGNEEDAQKYRESTRDRLLWWLRNVGNLALYNSIDRVRFDHSSDLAILIFQNWVPRYDRYDQKIEKKYSAVRINNLIFFSKTHNMIL